jgi:two-component system phosphate regulon sensor histidine kinase PhoR
MRAALADARTGPVVAEYREPGRPQHVRSVSFNAFRLPGEAGQRLLVTVDDLSDREAVARMRVDFVANASHELRTPLASLTASIETLLGPARNDPAAQERFLEMMREQANRMRRLTDDLLSLSRVELRQHRPPTTEVDAVAALREAVEVIAPLARQQSVTLAVDAPDAPVQVLGDRGELIQVFQNLLENAIRHGAAGGRVEVIAKMPENGPPVLAVHVRDFGPGIAAEHLPRLTERFYRVENGGAQRGTGLGLAIVKHILTRHGGRLEIASRPGEGATFSAEIAVIAGPPAEDLEKSA